MIDSDNCNIAVQKGLGLGCHSPLTLCELNHILNMTRVLDQCHLSTVSHRDRADLMICFIHVGCTLHRALMLHPSTYQLYYSFKALSSASLAARLALFASKLSLRIIRMYCCLSSTPWYQYPKLAPIPPKRGQTHNDSLLKKGRISRPSCQKRVPSPVAYILAPSS